jgi:copper chaperone
VQPRACSASPGTHAIGPSHPRCYHVGVMSRIHAATTSLLLGIAPVAIASLAGCGNGGSDGASAPAQVFTVTYSVEGMHCDGCVAAITNKVKGLKGVTACEVSLDEHRAVISMADPTLEPTIEETIKRLGYTVAKPTS